MENFDYEFDIDPRAHERADLMMCFVEEEFDRVARSAASPFGSSDLTEGEFPEVTSLEKTGEAFELVTEGLNTFRFNPSPTPITEELTEEEHEVLKCITESPYSRLRKLIREQCKRNKKQIVVTDDEEESSDDESSDGEKEENSDDESSDGEQEESNDDESSDDETSDEEGVLPVQKEESSKEESSDDERCDGGGKKPNLAPAGGETPLQDKSQGKTIQPSIESMFRNASAQNKKRKITRSVKEVDENYKRKVNVIMKWTQINQWKCSFCSHELKGKPKRDNIARHMSLHHGCTILNKKGEKIDYRKILAKTDRRKKERKRRKL